jgi:integrase
VARVWIRGEKRLTARQVQTLGPGLHADGGGLYLQVSATGARSWIYRFQMHKRRRDMGLGAVAVIGLQDARQRAAEARRQVAEGIDPIEHRERARAATGATWGDAMDALIENLRPGWKNAAQAEQWEQSLRDYGPKRDALLTSITTDTALALLRPIWADKTETATRVRGRCERVWDFARVSGKVAGDNPFRWKGHLDKLLARPSKVKKARHFAAMPYGDLPAFMATLRERESLGRLAMEFTILTVARTGEVTGCDWPEFDLAGAAWRIPGERMKAGAAHTIPLAPRAVEILRSLPCDKPPFALSENAMLFLLQRKPPRGLGQPYTVHGFRSAFSDWAHETTGFPNHVIEMALAHAIRNKAEAAYRRGDLMEKRRELMAAWAAYLG